MGSIHRHNNSIAGVDTGFDALQPGPAEYDDDEHQDRCLMSCHFREHRDTGGVGMPTG
jgi:hypothetical protein